MDILTDQNWLLSLGVFLPLAGVLVMLFVPSGHFFLLKQLPLISTLFLYATHPD